MEKEYKYRLDNDKVFDRIAEKMAMNKIGQGEVEEIKMKAVYFDTPDNDFRNNGIAYRIRHENEIITATIKWDTDVRDGYHVREEFNLVVNDERFAEHPDIEMFRSSEAYEVLHNAAGQKGLHMSIGMEYDRRQIKVDTGRSISCISEDTGVIHHIDGHDIPVHELEIELYYGDESDFNRLAAELRMEFGLEAEDASKLQRALL